jgi:peptide/nickel transport system permease protein
MGTQGSEEAKERLQPSRQIMTARQRAWRAFTRNRTALIGLVLIALLVVIAVAAPVIAPHDPLSQSARDRLASPSAEYWFGRDHYGRDIMSRVVYGARIALIVGITSVAFGGALGTLMGVVAGFKGGRTETVLMRITDVLLAFPDLITGLLILAVLGSGMWKMIFAIGITIAPRFTRIAYGATLSIKEMDYIDAARAVGVKDTRMLGVHVIPNMMGDIMVLASLWMASAIRLEASLSFIGLGISPPTPTWGQMIRDGTHQLAVLPWFALAPGIALLIAVFAFNLVGDGLRDVLDPRAQT